MVWELIATNPGGGGGDTVGAAVIRDSDGTMAVNAAYAETNPAPADPFEVALDALYAEVNAALSEGSSFYADMGDAETNPTPTDGQSVEVAPVTESNPVPTETDLSEVAVASPETNPAPGEGATVTVEAETETNPVPLPDHSTVSTQGAANVVASAPASGGQFANPTNANGLNNGTVAQATSAAGLGAPTRGGTLVFDYANLGTLTTETQTDTTVTLRVWGSVTVGTLATGSLALAYSLNGTDYTTLQTITSTNTFSATPLSFVITLNVANLSAFRVRAIGSVTGSATAASTINLDAFELIATHTGTAG